MTFVNRENRADPRLIAEALSDGLNVCDALVAAGPMTTPEPEWRGVLDSFVNALEAVRQGRLRTDMQVGDGEVERARQLAALVKHWYNTGQHDEQLVKLAFSLFSAFKP
ncbi:MAG: hypothetical protein IPK82_12940 [Polyangiaceae bacterium]|nr:hypothetical protein [Polyangiaceae bacterium]